MEKFYLLPERLLLRVTGSDRLRYLNGQLTNDLKQLTCGKAMQACLLTAKGKLSAVVWVLFQEEAIVLEAPLELSEELPARLERYLVADDVVIEVIPSEPTIHVFGELLDDSTLECIPGVSISRLASPGKDIKLSQLPADFLEQHHPLSEDFIEMLRIKQGIPKWGAELTPDRFPPEAHLEKQAISYKKGCYVGQEVISRLQSVGHVNRLLVLLITTKEEEELIPGMKLLSPGEPEKIVGFITSTTQEYDSGKFIALGYVTRNNTTFGTRLFAIHDGSKKTSEVVVEKF